MEAVSHTEANVEPGVRQSQTPLAARGRASVCLQFINSLGPRHYHGPHSGTAISLAAHELLQNRPCTESSASTSDTLVALRVTGSILIIEIYTKRKKSKIRITNLVEKMRSNETKIYLGQIGLVIWIWAQNGFIEIWGIYLFNRTTSLKQ